MLRTLMPFLMLLPLRAPDDGAGAAPPDGAAGGGASDAPPADAGAGAPPAATAPTPGLWADFLPDNLRGADDTETFGRLAADWKARRDADARRPQPPQSAADYTIEPGEKLKDYLGDPNDPVLTFAREAAFGIGLPKEHFSTFVTQIYEKAHEAGLLVPAYNPQAELKAVAERMAPGRPWAEQKPIVERALKDAASFAGVLGDQLKLSESAKGLLGALSEEAAGVELISALSGAMAPLPSFATSGAAAGGWTKESLDQAVRDPRYNPLGRDFDRTYRAQVDAGFRHVYGG